jgi:putative transcriptional regulator
MFVLGYAGWAAGQLDDEVTAGAWMPVPLSPAILYDTPFDQRWRAAFLSVGIDPDLWCFQTGEG